MRLHAAMRTFAQLALQRTRCGRRTRSARLAPKALALALVLIALSNGELHAQGDDDPPAPDVVDDAPPSAETAALAEDFRLPPDVTAELIAAEPLLQHPVAFAVDEQGRVFVAETFRVNDGVTDIRSHMDWLDEDLSAMTVEDRVDYMRRVTGEDFADYSANTDRVRLLLDTDDDGLFDAARTYATGFQSAAEGIGAGLAVRDGELFFACIPSLWKLRDLDDDGVADEQTALSTGYGVRITLLGHDLHGVTFGPDGRIWFSLGDRGLHVETPEGVLALPDQGAVLRCEPDGSGLELVHTGLRNPQEIAFDDFGNLFTVDNNADGGDKARLVYILPGGESGWRQPFQWLKGRGTWMRENWWRAEEHDVHFRLPPLAHVAAGPSGLVSDPGGLFPEPFTGGMLLADFRGGPSLSYVVGMQLEPEGAGFALESAENMVTGILATDVDVDPQGRILVSDWVDGWGHTGEGRLWRLSGGSEEQLRDGPRRAAELARPFRERSDAELIALLADPDRRLRDRAHLELATRPSSWDALGRIVREPGQLLPRWHALRALGVAARRAAPELAPSFVAPGLSREPELRALALELLGELAPKGVVEHVLPRLADDSPRVRLYAALATARLSGAPIGDPGAPYGARAPGGGPALENALSEREAASLTRALLARLRTDDADDPSLLHALSFALAGCGDGARLADLHLAPERGVRLGAVLALRRRGDGRVAQFLDDPAPELRAEAARALWDARLAHADSELMQTLAARLDTLALTDEESDDAVLRRALAAAQWLGTPHAVEQVFNLAENDEVSDELRRLALSALLEWDEEGDRDPLLGHRLLRDAHEGKAVHQQLRERVDVALVEEPEELLVRWMRLARTYKARAARPLLHAVLDAPGLSGDLRASALSTLLGWLDDDTARVELISRALGDPSAALRAAALAELGELDEALVLEHLPGMLANGTLPERRAALELAAALRDPRGEALLLEQWDAHARGRIPVELQLDLIQALPDSPSVALLARRRAALGGKSAMTLDGPRDALLFGGDRSAGKQIFEGSELSCVRCHERSGEGRHDEFVGPSLAGVGERLGRQQLLQELRDPNARLAPGFVSSNLFLHDGELITGRVLGEDAELIVLLDADGERHELEPARVRTRKEALSPMPEGLVEVLSPHEMRDLIAYLAGL